MSYQNTGTVISGAEVVQLTPFGLWLDINGTEYFLDHEIYPWFKKASVEDIWNLELDQNGNLHWPVLDIDLEVASLEQPEKYPLMYR